VHIQIVLVEAIIRGSVARVKPSFAGSPISVLPAGIQRRTEFLSAGNDGTAVTNHKLTNEHGGTLLKGAAV
jgi:hypothetical protein